jgi:ankyrin repeat protein
MSEVLLRAVETGDVAQARRLLTAGANPNDDGWGLPLIDEAVDRQDAAMVALLVEFGADLTGVDAEGRTRLHRAAAAADDPDPIGFLIDVGLDPNATDSAGWTALRYASVYGFERVASLLLRRGARPN